MYRTLLTDEQDQILTITINRPEKLNALNQVVIGELSQVISLVYEQKQIRSAIITGAGTRSFVAGADISEFLTMDAAAGRELARNGQESLFNRIEQCPKPVVAAVNGFALGGGCELAMSCHIRIAAENARFGQPEVNLGLIPGYGGTQRLTRLIGRGRALEFMMTGNMISAREAENYGLVNHVFTQESLMEETRKLLLGIHEKSSLAISKLISAVNAMDDKLKNGYEEEIELFGQCFGTSDMKEGVSAFLEKRKPDFSHPGR